MEEKNMENKEEEGKKEQEEKQEEQPAPEPQPPVAAKGNEDMDMYLRIPAPVVKWGKRIGKATAFIAGGALLVFAGSCIAEGRKDDDTPPQPQPGDMYGYNEEK